MVLVVVMLQVGLGDSRLLNVLWMVDFITITELTGRTSFPKESNPAAVSPT